MTVIHLDLGNIFLSHRSPEMFTAYINFPAWIKPEIIPNTPLRWYGLMYVFAFATAWGLFNYQIKKMNEKRALLEIPNPVSKDIASNFIMWAIIGLMLGARIFSVLVYSKNPGPSYYLMKPWLIFWPFQGNKFTGLAGMSYHGGVIGTIIATVAYCRVYRLNFWKWADMLAAAIPLGYTFGRLGNFANQELYGRVTDSPIGMIFTRDSHVETFRAGRTWVTDLARELSITPVDGTYNFPRHPSQLYEAFFEGIILWLVLWFVVRLFKKHNGQVIGSYLMGYGIIRFFIEYFRQPDEHLGYIFGDSSNFLILAKEHPWNAISMGQILCFFMIIGGLALLLMAKKLDGWNEKALIKWGPVKIKPKKGTTESTKSRKG